jgi:hypothetical protein
MTDALGFARLVNVMSADQYDRVEKSKTSMENIKISDTMDLMKYANASLQNGREMHSLLYIRIPISI